MGYTPNYVNTCDEVLYVQNCPFMTTTDLLVTSKE